MLGVEIKNSSLCQNQVYNTGYDTLSSVMAENVRQETNYLTNETFHTPSFDDDFDITSLALPTVSEVLAQTTSQQNYTTQQPLLYNFGTMDFALSQPQQTNGTNSSTVTTVIGGDQVVPKFPPQNFDVPDISITNSLHSTSSSMLTSMAMMTTSIDGRNQNGSVFSQQSNEPLTTISHSDVTAQLSFQNNSMQTSPCNSSNSTSPLRDSSSGDSDENLPLAQLALLKRQACATVAHEEKPTSPPRTTGKAKKTPKKKKKKDPNEPQKPVSAYALFFRDTQAAIKGQNPSASFGEVSKIVASMWDGLEPDTKSVYKKKTEMEKKEYLKKLAAYKASLVVSQIPMEDNSFNSVMNDKPRIMRSSMHPNSNMPMHQASPNMSPVQRPNMSPQGQSLSPPQGQNMSPVQGPNLSPHQHQTNMVPTTDSMDIMGMNLQGGNPSQMGYVSPPHPQIGHSGSSPQQQLVPSPPRMLQAVTARQPVLGQLMEEANLCLDGGGLMQSMCIRNGCTNPTIDNPGWDNEYCSNECVVSHCRDVFTAWVSARQGSGHFTVK